MSDDEAAPVESIPPMPGHVWRFSLADWVAHQFPEALEPDAEGILTALCGAEAMAFRVLTEFRPPHCLPCILVHGGREADELDGARDRLIARVEALAS